MVNFLQRSYPKWNGSSRTETVLNIAIIVSALLLRSSKGCERTGMWIEFKGRSILAPGDTNSCNPAAASLLAPQRWASVHQKPTLEATQERFSLLMCLQTPGESQGHKKNQWPSLKNNI